MKRMILVILCLGLAGFPVLAQDDLVVGVNQEAGAEWESIVTSFEAQAGGSVGIRPYPQNTIAQQVVLHGFSRSGELDLVTVPASWAASLSRYLVDLSGDAAALSARGAQPVYIGSQAIGVRLPFASDWYLAVLSWPQDRQLAIDFLVHAATSGTSAGAATTPQAAAGAFSSQKLPAADHNPLLDGAFEAILGAARAAGASSTTMGLATSIARAAAAALASQYGVPFSSSAGTVTVVLESRPGRSAASTASAVAALGVSRSSIETSSTLVKATVSLAQLADLAAGLTGVSFIRPPYVPFPLATSTQGVAAIGAAAFHTTGFDGTGVKIAVIDLGFAGLSQAQANGDLPYSVQQNDLTGTGLTTGITHGTAVAEIIHDVAPGAQLHLIKIADDVDLDAAVTYCLSQGIDIINHSLGWYNTNFYDGTGTIADIARRAISGGILWVNAAGNEAESHWEGVFTDGNSDGRLDQTITLYAASGSQIVLFLTWNDWPQASSDYDLYLYSPTSSLVASSTKYQTGTEEPTESIQVSAPVSGTYTIRIQGSGSKSLELYSLYQSVSPAIASSSILAPGNVAEVVTVGAIDYALYTVGPQESYSSQGPTNDGRTKPNLCAPDKVSTGTAPYTTFYGTSGAAPHAAGAAALLLDQNATLSEPALRAQLLSQTVAMGSPNVYGNGRLYLQSPTTPNQPPVATFTHSPTSPVVGSAVTFNGTNSTDPDGSITAYAWTFGDGASGSGANVSHAYSAAGTYTARLTVTDDDGATGTSTASVSVTLPGNQPPVASFTVSPSSGSPGTTFTFNGTSSYDPDGNIVSHLWDYGDGSSGSGASTQHAYASTGTFTVRLTVTDNRGAANATTRSVTVQAVARPDLIIDGLTPSPTNPMIGQNVAFTIVLRNAGTAAAGTFRVRLAGAASSTQTYLTQLPAGASQTLTLALPLTASPETFTATADDLNQIVESNEANNTRTATVTSAVVPPVAEAGGPYSGVAGSPIAFTGSASTGPISTYLWSFGDGTTAQGVTVSHTYANPGTYPVTLTVFTSGGQQATDSTQAAVSAPSPSLAVQLSLPKSSYQIGEAIVITFTTNRTAYVYLCDVSTDERVTLMLPNWIESTNPLGAGSHTVPGAPYTLRITEPAGTETLYLFAATSPLPQFPTTFTSGFPLLSTNPSSFRDSVLATMQSQLPSGSWAYDTLSFQVVSPTPTTGSLRVVTSPSGASVRLDGSTIGTSPVTRDGVTPGTHSVRLSRTGYTTETHQVVITAGQTTTLSVTLTSQPTNQPPVADFIYTPPGPIVGSPVTFNGSSSYDPDGSIVSYNWDFGDGGSSTQPMVSHAFASARSYNVRLTVTDNGGATNTKLLPVVVSSVEDIGWIPPTTYEDPTGTAAFEEGEPYEQSRHGWIREPNAYDNLDHTKASYYLRGRTWTSFFILGTVEAGLLCDGVRILVYDGYQNGNALEWDVDVYRDGAWVNVFDGAVDESEWKQITFAAGTVTKMRMRAFVTRVTRPSEDMAVHIQEVDFHDATASP